MSYQSENFVVDIFEQSMDDYCPIMAFLEGEPVKFDQQLNRWMINPGSEFEFTYRLDLGSATIDGPHFGKIVKLIICHREYDEMCDKSLEFGWMHGLWRLVDWTPKKMSFPKMEKCDFVVPEVMQVSLTSAIRKLGKKRCQEFDFLNEKPKKRAGTSCSSGASGFSFSLMKLLEIGENFVPCQDFAGSFRGYYFGTGDLGLGYYKDTSNLKKNYSEWWKDTSNLKKNYSEWWKDTTRVLQHDSQGDFVWRSGKVDGKVDARVDARVDGKVDAKVDEKVDGKVDGKVDEKVDEKVDGKVDERVDARVDSFDEYLSYRKDVIEQCADELLDIIDCGDEEPADRLGQYFEKILEKYL